MKRFFCFFSYLFVTCSIFCQTAIIQIKNVIQNEYNNGIKGITVKSKLEIDGAKGKTLEVTAWFYKGYNGEGGKAYGSKSGYIAEDNHICTYTNITPSYDGSIYEDFKLFIPYSAFPRGGKYSLRVDILYGSKLIEKSGWYNFTISSSSSSSSYNYGNDEVPQYIQCRFCVNGMEFCKTCHGYGRTMQMGYRNGSHNPYEQICYVCRGTKQTPCSICGGSQRIKNPVYGMPIKEKLIGGVKCMSCYGTGASLCTKCFGIYNSYNCYMCKGRMIIQCPGCLGYGWITNDTPNIVRTKTDCTSCLGKGFNVKQIYVGGRVQTTKQKCYVCGGSGKVNDYEYE